MRIDEVMSAQLVTIEHDESVGEAHALMRRHHIRHLPVTSRGRLVGLLSDRDILRLLSLSGVDADEEPVEEAMTEAPFAVAPESSVAWVAKEMAAGRYGSAVVVTGDRPIGIVTAVDALLALARVLERSP